MVSYFDSLFKIFFVFLRFDLVYYKNKTICIFEMVGPQVWVFTTQVPYLE